MKKIRKNQKSAFNLHSLTLEGALFLPDQLEKAALGQASQQKDADYHVPTGLKLKDEYSRAFQIASAQWKQFSQHFDRSDVDALALTQSFVKDLLQHAFAYHSIQTTAPILANERAYPVSFIAEQLPIVVAPFNVGLDESIELFAVEGSGSRKKSAFQLAQELLNASDQHLWAIATNGRQLRLLRDAASLTRPSFLEVDLEDILQAQRFSEFTNAWRLIHASRAPQSTQSTDSIWESWRAIGQEEGTRVRDGLRQGVEQALLTLGTGFIQHPANSSLRQALDQGTLSKDAYFQQLLRLVYRFIFLFTVEERGLLHPKDDSKQAQQARQAYAQGYALARLRELCLKRRARNRFDDHWQAIRIVFKGLEQGQPHLALPALGGLFASEQTPDLDRSSLSNADFLQAIQHLRWAVITQGKSTNTIPVDYRNMGPEELGSVYESLLELVPTLNLSEKRFGFVGLTDEGSTAGNTRKLTGSYYTPGSLVQQLIQSALEPVIAQRLAANPSNPTEALLSIRVVDPACGSGHFLLAAARRLAEELAQLRSLTSGQEGAIKPQDYRHALREVIGHCIFGVDRNPMAIELARMALWLEGFAEGCPLNFLDHHLQVGDALLGLTDLNVLEYGISKDAFKALSGDDKEVCKLLAAQNNNALKQLEKDRKNPQFKLPLELNSQLTELQRIEAMPQNTLKQTTSQEAAYAAFLEKTQNSSLRNAADILVGAYLLPKTSGIQSQVPTTATLMLELMSGADNHNAHHQSKRQAALLACADASVFHWPLAFPQVFAQGGFDCVLGNPPWERISIEDVEFFSKRVPEIAETKITSRRKKLISNLEKNNSRYWLEYTREKEKIFRASSFFKFSGLYPLGAVGRLNTYALFSDRVLSLVSDNSYIGLVLPSGILTDAPLEAYCRHVFGKNMLRNIVEFENTENIFPGVHKEQRFCLLTLSKENKINEKGISVYIGLKKIDEIYDDRRRYFITSEDLNRISPFTLQPILSKTLKSYELSKKIYQNSMVFSNSTEVSAYAWVAMTSSGFSSKLRYRSELDLGCDYLPIYEGKMIHQYDCNFSTYEGVSEEAITKGNPNLNDKKCYGKMSVPRYFIDKDIGESFLNSKIGDQRWVLCYRDVTNVNNERTAIGTILPRYPLMQPLNGITVKNARVACFVLGALNSLIVDFIARQRFSGRHLNVTTFSQLPLPYKFLYQEEIIYRVASLLNLNEKFKPLLAELNISDDCFSVDENIRSIYRAELDAYYARLYGLNRDELRYILDPIDVMGEDYPDETFRALKNSEIRKFGEYRTQRLVLEAWDALEKQ